MRAISPQNRRNPELAGRRRVMIVTVMQPTLVDISQPVAMPVRPDPAWDEAFLRVESYLRAHHLESRVLLNQLATDIIQGARGRTLANPGEEPVAAAMHVAHTRIGAWFARAGNAGDWSDARVRVRGRLALVLADLPGRWADCFLAVEPVPPDLATALDSGVLQPGPVLRFSNMPPAPLEFGFNDPDVSSAHPQGGWLMLREASAWLAIVGLFGVAWAASH